MKLELLPLDKTAVFARLDSGELITYALCDVFRPGASKEEFAANARRIVACFNACAGISTENLEDNVPIKELARRYNETLKQRDELLAAIEKCRKELSAWMRDHGDDIATQEAVADARAAIASVKGQK